MTFEAGKTYICDKKQIEILSRTARTITYRDWQGITHCRAPVYVNGRSGKEHLWADGYKYKFSACVG